MKKLLLTLGTVAAVAAPVAAVVACGSDPVNVVEQTKALLKTEINGSTSSVADKKAALAELDKVKDQKGLTAFENSDLYKKIASTFVTTSLPNGGGTQGAQGATLGQNVTADSIEQLLKAKGYVINDPSNAETETIFDKLLENTVQKLNVNFHFGAVAGGKVKDNTQRVLAYDTHNADDFLIVVKGGTVITDDTTAKDAGKSAELVPTDTKFTGQWGDIKTGEFDGATSIIYLHHTGTDPKAATINIVKIIKDADGKLYEVSKPDLVTTFQAIYTAPTK